MPNKRAHLSDTGKNIFIFVTPNIHQDMSDWNYRGVQQPWYKLVISMIKHVFLRLTTLKVILHAIFFGQKVVDIAPLDLHFPIQCYTFISVMYFLVKNMICAFVPVVVVSRWLLATALDNGLWHCCCRWLGGWDLTFDVKAMAYVDWCMRYWGRQSWPSAGGGCHFYGWGIPEREDNTREFRPNEKQNDNTYSTYSYADVSTP